jgi:CRP-like cAMP-binding protein
LAGKLAQADEILHASMAGTGKAIPAGQVLVRESEALTTVYRLTRGKVARIRTLEDGRRQIICIFSPGDLLGVKAMLLDGAVEEAAFLCLVSRASGSDCRNDGGTGPAMCA